MLTTFRAPVHAHRPPRTAHLDPAAWSAASVPSPVTEIPAQQRGNVMLAAPGGFALPNAWTHDQIRAVQRILVASRPRPASQGRS